MTGISDYALRVAYYRKRYEQRRDAYNANARAYRKRNRETLKVARGLGVSIPRARALLAQIEASP